ncbi:hypothetical protein Mapa_011339 [Marchantia paleacea]|nr:hypothetical protein Mapa_011339 [Marchantia paleacea]
MLLVWVLHVIIITAFRAHVNTGFAIVCPTNRHFTDNEAESMHLLDAIGAPIDRWLAGMLLEFKSVHFVVFPTLADGRAESINNSSDLCVNCRHRILTSETYHSIECHWGNVEYETEASMSFDRHRRALILFE